MDSHNLPENHLIWSKKNSSKNCWCWFLAGTLLNLTVTSLIVGSMLFYVHVELQSVKVRTSHCNIIVILHFWEGWVNKSGCNPEETCHQLNDTWTSNTGVNYLSFTISVLSFLTANNGLSCSRAHVSRPVLETTHMRIRTSQVESSACNQWASSRHKIRLVDEDKLGPPQAN